MDHQDAIDFAGQWVQDWNSHDLDAILGHFSDDIVFSSPVAALLLPDTGGVLRGKQALRAYWAVGLERIPDLRFELVAVYTGVDSVVINYRNHVGSLVCEVLSFEGPLVARGHGTYLQASAAAASGLGDS